MYVVNKIVYRIVPFKDNVKKGETVSNKTWKGVNKFKVRIEESLEKCRPCGFPRREECLYVCFSKENAYEWAFFKYKGKTLPYKLLTLKITGDIYWLKSNCYNFLQNDCNDEELVNASKSYWASEVYEECSLKLEEGVEGLFVGCNKVIDIEYKQFQNNESEDIT